jgi:hypothetical protein
VHTCTRCDRTAAGILTVTEPDELADAIVSGVLRACQAGELRGWRGLTMIANCLNVVSEDERDRRVGQAFRIMRGLKKKTRVGRLPPYPGFVKDYAYGLVTVMRELRAELPFRPTSKSRSSVLGEAIKQLVALELSPATRPLSPQTLDRWCRERRRRRA